MQGCDACRRALAEMAELRDAARSLEQLEPRPEVWFNIKRRVSEIGVLNQHKDTKTRGGQIRNPGMPRRFGWRWGFAAAAAGIVVAALIAVRAERARLSSAVARMDSERLEDAALAQEYEAYVRGMDEAIEECEAALNENPQNARVKLAYLTARSGRLDAMDRFTAGGR